MERDEWSDDFELTKDFWPFLREDVEVERRCFLEEVDLVLLISGLMLSILSSSCFTLYDSRFKSLIDTHFLN